MPKTQCVLQRAVCAFKSPMQITRKSMKKLNLQNLYINCKYICSLFSDSSITELYNPNQQLRAINSLFAIPRQQHVTAPQIIHQWSISTVIRMLRLVLRCSGTLYWKLNWQYLNFEIVEGTYIYFSTKIGMNYVKIGRWILEGGVHLYFFPGW